MGHGQNLSYWKELQWVYKNRQVHICLGNVQKVGHGEDPTRLQASRTHESMREES